MIQRLKQLPATDLARRFWETIQSSLAPALLRRRTFSMAALTILLAILYWGIIASNRYVSESQLVIQRTDMTISAVVDIGSLISGGGGGNRADQLLLRSHLLSVDMLKKLDAKLNLRAHYSDTTHDIISRMWRKEAEMEWFHKNYLERTSIVFDEYAGILVIKVQAYDAPMALAINQTLVEEGEKYMNELSHQIARDQVTFLEKQVNEMGVRAIQARHHVITYQNQRGLLSPLVTAQNIQGIVNNLEAKLVDLQARRGTLLGYLSLGAPGVVEIDMQINAIEKQIQQEKARLTSTQGISLNTMVEEYQRLELAAKFAEDVYKSALIALEKGRIEALRSLRKVAVLQTPTLPEYPLEPRRIYNIFAFIISALIIAGIIHLLAAVIRDHQD